MAVEPLETGGWRSDDHARSIYEVVGYADGIDDPITSTFAGAEIDKEDLIVGVINEFGQFASQLQQVDR